MIFTQLIIENFGVYRGQNSFNFRPYTNIENRHSIVLIGGKNGSGKTTILDAIRLCLYGRSTLGSRVRQRDYEQYVWQRIHRNYGDKQNTAKIQLTFEHTHAGNKSIYNAIRCWRADGKKFEEEISLYRDGEVLQDIPSDHWNDFLRDLIPPGVADLFFFDGEQIQSLANDMTEADALADAVRGLLNLELVERLQSDLNIFLRQQKQKDQSNLEQLVTQAYDILKSIEEQILRLRQGRAPLMSQLDRAKNKVEQSRQTLLSQGAGFIEKRDTLYIRRSQIDHEIEQISNDIRNMASELLPFAFASPWSRQLQSRLELEENAKQEMLTFEVAKSMALKLTNILHSDDFYQSKATTLNKKEWYGIVEEISQILLPSQSHGSFEVRHHISEQVRQKLYVWIARVQSEIPQQLNSLTADLEKLEIERASIETLLNYMPEDIIATPLLDDFQQWSLERGSLEERIDAIDEQIHKLHLEKSEIERRIRNLNKELAEAEGLDIRIQRAAKAKVILDDYLEIITKAKVQELESTFIEYFNLLSRKKGLVHTIIIDSRDFSTKLFGANQEFIPKRDLSAGEKQLYAMALLWALRAVSGRVLPIIMDTPMGRLDSDHRAALLENFFPHVAHQVILLSTDLEIDKDAYSQLEESISHAYYLDFDEESGCAQIVEGYWGYDEIRINQ